MVCDKFDSSDVPQKRVGRPRKKLADRRLAIKLMRENPSTGNLGISGNLKDVGIDMCAETVRQLRKENKIPFAPIDKTRRWAKFFEQNKETLWEGDSFTTEVLNENNCQQMIKQR